MAIWTAPPGKRPKDNVVRVTPEESSSRTFALTGQSVVSCRLISAV